MRRVEARIARRRKARLHVISARLTHHFDAVAVEDLNLRGLNRGGGGGAAGRGIRKSWRDRAPGALVDMLTWKSHRDGRRMASVDPRGTNCVRRDSGGVCANPRRLIGAHLIQQRTGRRRQNPRGNPIKALAYKAW